MFPPPTANSRRYLFFLLLALIAGGLRSTPTCLAQVSSLDGAHWITVQYYLQPLSGLAQMRLSHDGRGLTTLRYTLRDESVLDNLLQLKPDARQKVAELLREYDSARLERSQGFLFDPERSNWEDYLAGAPAWKTKWQGRLKETLEAESLTKLEQATIRWVFNAMGIESILNLHLGREPLLGMDRDQQQKFMALIQKRREAMAAQNQDSFKKHQERVLSVLTGEQNSHYEKHYSEYVNSLQPSLEFLIFQLSIQDSDELIETKVIPSADNPNAWLALPMYFGLKPNGSLQSSSSDRLRVGDRKIELLKDPQLADVLELSDNQSQQLVELHEYYRQKFVESGEEYNRRVNAARELHGFVPGHPGFRSEQEKKVDREIFAVILEEQARLDQALEREIDQILVPRQVEQLELLAGRSEILVVGLLNGLRHGRLGRQLKISAKQKEQLQRLQGIELRDIKEEAKRQSKIFHDEWMAMLTDDQRKAWDEIFGPENDFMQPTPNLFLIPPSGF